MTDILKRFSNLILEKDKINIELYDKYNVKRGLRNSDGTGVLVGLTNIGNVHGYIMADDEKVPAEGRLTYRGFDVMELVNAAWEEKRFGFEECCYLLLFGQLPDKEMLQEFNDFLGNHRFLYPGFTEDMILKAPSKDIMNKIAMAVLAMYSYDLDPDNTGIENVLRQCISLIARFPALTAYSYESKIHNYDNKSLFIHSPRSDLSTAENILHMIRPNSSYTENEVRLLDVALIIHAEHGGGNNSSFVTHAVTSTGTDTYSAIAAALGSLKGPQHGGANLKVVAMMKEIKEKVKRWDDETEVASYLKRIVEKEAFDHSGLIYGIGHAVYTLSDPRAVLLKERAGILAKEKGMEEEFNLYKLIERIAPEVFYKVTGKSKTMCANVDLYSGFVYQMLNIPEELFTPIFAIGRMPGWAAHRIEEIVSGGRIIRPAYKSVSGKRKYIPICNRKNNKVT